ncbi:MAG: methyltransferase [Acidobacteriota bacterium]
MSHGPEDDAPGTSEGERPTGVWPPREPLDRLKVAAHRVGLWLRSLAVVAQQSGPAVVWTGGTPLVIVPGVGNPTRSLGGRLLRELLASGVLPPGASVLDVGCGSGALTVEAARWARRVAAVDLRPEAVRCTRINVLLNRCDDRVVVRQGDLFEPVAGNRFDAVVCEPPVTRGGPGAAPNDPEFLGRFARGLPAFLTSAGVAYLALTMGAGEDAGLAALEHAGLLCQPARRGSTFRAVVTVYRCTRHAHP